MTAGTLPRMGDTHERCAVCGTREHVEAIMYPEAWPICKRCAAANGAETLREELWGA